MVTAKWFLHSKGFYAVTTLLYSNHSILILEEWKTKFGMNAKCSLNYKIIISLTIFRSVDCETTRKWSSSNVSFCCNCYYVCWEWKQFHQCQTQRWAGVVLRCCVFACKRHTDNIGSDDSILMLWRWRLPSHKHSRRVHHHCLKRLWEICRNYTENSMHVEQVVEARVYQSLCTEIDALYCYLFSTVLSPNCSYLKVCYPWDVGSEVNETIKYTLRIAIEVYTHCTLHTIFWCCGYYGVC